MAEVTGILRSEDSAQNDMFRVEFVKGIFAFMNRAGSNEFSRQTQFVTSFIRCTLEKVANSS